MVQQQHPNPYIAGSPVSERAMFFGRDDDFDSNARTRSQRGFVELKSGETIEGMIALKGKVKIVGGFHSPNILYLLA